ncbi:hypothetical protein PL78_18180 [Yersinia entomophaga]|uniref:Type III secretion target, IpaC/SipC family n=1 Tax=Yersinia entomophaga TaxID=935293 RepID=A0ABM6BQN9_YERET|nr:MULTISPECIES: hypothetical protein [Yersinia]ANI31736.1 hypothetical protein PL78_18180 [Yersinia entomophaga]
MSSSIGSNSHNLILNYPNLDITKKELNGDKESIKKNANNTNQPTESNKSTAENKNVKTEGKISPQAAALREPQGEIQPTASKLMMVDLAEKRTTAAVSPADDTPKPAIAAPTVETQPTLLQEQLKHITGVSNFAAEQTKATDAAQPKQGFAITNLNNSFGARLSNVVMLAVKVLTEMRVAENKLGGHQLELSAKAAQASAAHTIQSGKEARNQAITQGVVGLATTVGGQARAMKGTKMSNKSLDVSKQQANFQNQANKSISALNKVGPGQKPGSAVLQNDKSIIEGGAIHDKQYSATLKGIESSRQMNNAQKVIGQGNAASQMGNPMGAVAASQFQVNEAEEKAGAAIQENEKSVKQETHAESVKRSDRDKQLLNLLMNMLFQTVTAKNETISSMINNKV